MISSMPSTSSADAPADAARGNALVSDDEMSEEPPEEMTADEENLREAVLAAVSKGENGTGPGMTLDSVIKDEEVSRCKRILEPCGYFLQMALWIQTRMKDQVVLEEGRGKKKGVKNSRFVKLIRQDTEENGEKDEKDESHVELNGFDSDEPGESVEDRSSKTSEEFFASLPADEFIREEIDLRQNLLKWIKQEKRSAPEDDLLLDTALQNESIKKTARFLQRKSIALEDWVATRMGSEITIDLASSGGYTVSLPASMGEEDEDLEDVEEVEEVEEEPSEDKETSKQRRDRERKERKGKGKGRSTGQEDMESFYQNLPVGSFTDEEDLLRVAILAYFECKEEAALLEEVHQDEAIKEAKDMLLPNMSYRMLREWIWRRLSNEIEIQQIGAGHALCPASMGPLDISVFESNGKKRKREEPAENDESTENAIKWKESKKENSKPSSRKDDRNSGSWNDQRNSGSWKDKQTDRSKNWKDDRSKDWRDESKKWKDDSKAWNSKESRWKDDSKSWKDDSQKWKSDGDKWKSSSGGKKKW